MKIGILALQGDFQAHGRTLEKLGKTWIRVLSPGDFDRLQGLIIPGGESSALLKLLTPELQDAMVTFAGKGGVIYGTCAGIILLAKKVLNPSQRSLGLLDATVVRNGYGRHIDSFVIRGDDTEVKGKDPPSELVFIRAPVIEEIGPEVEVLIRVKGNPVHVKEGNIMATTFHPELTGDPSIHGRFLEMVERAHGENNIKT